MTCMDLNLYLCGVLASLMVSNIFWYLMWCNSKRRLKNFLHDLGLH